MNDTFGEKIVRIHAGDEWGTGFFISNNTLMTARHVVCNAHSNNSPITIEYNDKIIGACRLIKDFGEYNLNIAILESSFEVSSFFTFLKLPCENSIHTSLSVVGYPLLYHGARYRAVIEGEKIGHDNSTLEYDILGHVMSPSHPLEHYKGLSGSPVLNRRGYVVGVMTTQQISRLGYTSIENAASVLLDNDIKVNDGWREQDMSRYGLGTSRSQIDKAIERAGKRYSSEINIGRPKLKDDLDKILNYSVYITSKENLNKAREVIQYVYNNDLEYQRYLNLKHPDININTDSLESLLPILIPDDYYKLDDSSLSRLGQIKMNNFIITRLEKYCEESEKQILILAKAGHGKTHFLCDYAKNRNSQTYLLFGTQFNNSDPCKDQICSLLNFANDSGLTDLNNKMKQDKDFAVIIIDGINEGVGIKYWSEQLKNLSRLEYVRFIFSIRDSVEFTDFPDVSVQKISGFENQLQDLGDLCEKFGIYDEDFIKQLNEISSEISPLFAKLLCENYTFGQTDFSKINAYLRYIDKRNTEISEIVDEDPRENITSSFLLGIANRSIHEFKFQDLPRKICREISDNILPHRYWSNSLLNAGLTSNLLVQTQADNNIDFEYEEMGDALKAHLLVKETLKETSDIDKSTDLFRTSLSSHYITNIEKINNVVRLYFEDSRIRRILQTRGDILSEFIRFIEIKPSGDPLSISILIDKLPIVLSRQIIETPTLLDSDLCLRLHKALINHSMKERDKAWTHVVNWFFNTSSYLFLENITTTETLKIKDKCILLGWVLASSYPIVRRYSIWHIVNLLNEDKSVILDLLGLFLKCNDAYVVEGILCSIYGFLLLERYHVKSEFIDAICENIYEFFYKTPETIPSNIRIRFWSLKIIELGQLICSKPWLEKIFKQTSINPDNTYDVNAIDFDATNENSFGSSNGSIAIKTSLCDFSDFNRYVIGTNNLKDSDIFVDKITKEPILLDNIIKATGSEILSLGWDDELGNLDNTFQSGYNRFENPKERIGKKYQWIALQNVYGNLSDVCNMIDIYNNTYQHNYPWYTNLNSGFDPTLMYKRQEEYKINIKDFTSLEINGDSYQWLKNENDLDMNPIIHKDENGEEWVILSGILPLESINRLNNIKCRFHEIDNSVIIKNEDLDEMKRWAEKQDFYGRWMPESTGSIGFLWNEYPWSDSFKQYIEDSGWIDCPHKDSGSIMLSYASQLQEDTMGTEIDDRWPSSAYAPCPDIMDKLNLYTAERGVVRAIDTDEIIAIHSYMVGMHYSGLLIRRKELDKYLRDTDCSLMFYKCGEKTVEDRESIQKYSITGFSGAAFYEVKNGLSTIQKSHMTRDF